MLLRSLGLAALAAIAGWIRWLLRRPPRVAHALIVSPPDHTAFDQRSGAVRSTQSADVIIPTLSLEQMRRVFGLPEMRIPINDSFNVVSVPELSVYSRRDRVGVAEFSGFLYEPTTGAPLGAITPMTGEFRIRSHKLLMIVAWGQQTIDPGERDPGDSWREV